MPAAMIVSVRAILAAAFGNAVLCRAHAHARAPERADAVDYWETQHVPRVQFPFSANDEDAYTAAEPPKGMQLHKLAVSGDAADRVNLAIFADGYTAHESGTFLDDARALSADIVADGGAMAHVADLLNVWAVFVPSKTSGIGINVSLDGAPFGLYRNGRELRGVYPTHVDVARAACKYWRDERGACDQPVLLGNDGLYGGLGGEFTIVTASERNGKTVLRHELGHSLIPVGEEYEGGEVYSGVNSDMVENVHNLSWARFLSDPANVRIEDTKVPLQAYPWHDLEEDGNYSVKFTASDAVGATKRQYPSAFLRASMSSIAKASHVRLAINGHDVDLGPAFPPDWDGVLDRRWVELPLPNGIPPGPGTLEVSLTPEGRAATTGQGGKMISSVEIMEYAGDGRFNPSPGFVGAFPTYSINGSATLRPTNDGCLMRNVNLPYFCVVCKDGLRRALEKRIAERKRAG